MSNQILTPEQFKRLSRAKRAVIIAKDVITQLNNGNYAPQTNYSTSFIKRQLPREYDNKDAATFMKENPDKIRCVGCARASLFISAVKFKNTLKVHEVKGAGFDYDTYAPYNYYEGSINATKFLSDEFDKTHQCLIEVAFERNTEYGYELEDKMSSRQKSNWRKLKTKAFEWGENYEKKWKNWRGSTSRKKPTLRNYLLTKICENIIKNKGTFKP